MVSNEIEKPRIDDLSGREVGRFVLGEFLAEGGCGTLYRCSQPSLGREAVIKVLCAPRRGDKEAEARFLREARLASRLDHHFAAHVYDFGVEPDGLRWIAMELVPGVTLDELLRRRGPMKLSDFVPLFECIADVVDAAHERSIVHRDLKPANVMVIVRGSRMVPKLLDFGIAKLLDDGQLAAPDIWPDGTLGENRERADAVRASGEDTDTNPATKEGRTPSRAELGSWAYMAPEQWEAPRTVGPAADLYALAILVYKALTGRVPFTASTSHSWRHQHLYAEVPPLGGDLPVALDRVLQRGLAKRPEDRYGSASELAQELRAVLMASERELLRSMAQQWDACARPVGLLLGRDVLEGVERWSKEAPSGTLSKLECSYVAASHRRVRRAVWLRRLSVALAATLALGALLNHQLMELRVAQEHARGAQHAAEVTATMAELEQGRAALLHGEADAELHLAEAYKRGERSPSTAFMLARALAPRLAQRARLPSISGRMWSAEYSRDGQHIITTDDGGVQLWDSQSGSAVAKLPQTDAVYQGLFLAGGSQFATAHGDGRVRIWNASDAHLIRVLAGRAADTSRRYGRLAASPNGHYIAAIDISGEIVTVWDFVNGKLLTNIRNPDAAEAPAIAFSSDGQWLALTGGNDIQVVNTNTWRPSLSIKGYRTRRLAFDPFGPRLLSGGAGGDVALWDVSTGARLRHLHDVGESIDAVAFSPNGQLIAAAGRDGMTQIWRTSGDLLSHFNARHTKVMAIEFDASSSMLLAAGADGAVVVADAIEGMPIAVLEGPQSGIWAAHFDPSSKRIIGASLDGTARVWDAQPSYRRWSAPPMSDSCGVVTGAEPDQRFIAISCGARGTRVWDTARNLLLAEFPRASTEGNISTVSKDGSRAAIAHGSEVELYDIVGQRLLRTIKHTALVSAVAFASGSMDLVSGGEDGSLIVTRDQGVSLAFPKSPAGIDATVFLADGRLVVSDADRRLSAYDTAGHPIGNLALPMRVMSLRPNGDRIIAIPLYTDTAGPPLLIDLQNQRIVAKLTGHVGRVFSARWVSGDLILTAGGDGSARLWDGASGQLQQIFRGGARFLADAALSSDGRMVLGADADGLLRFWDRSNGRPLWTLQAHKSHLIGIHVEGDDIVTRGFGGEISRWSLPDPEQLIGACGDELRCAIIQP